MWNINIPDINGKGKEGSIEKQKINKPTNMSSFFNITPERERETEREQ